MKKIITLMLVFFISPQIFSQVSTIIKKSSFDKHVFYVYQMKTIEVLMDSVLSYDTSLSPQHVKLAMEKPGMNVSLNYKLGKFGNIKKTIEYDPENQQIILNETKHNSGIAAVILMGVIVFLGMWQLLFGKIGR